MLEAGLTSRTRLASEQGEEFDDILDELAAEHVAMMDAGLDETPEPKQAAEDAPEVLAAKAIAAGNVRAAELRRDAAVASQPQIHVHQGAVNVTTPAVRNEITVQPAEAPVNNIVNEIHEREQREPVINFAPTTNVAAPNVEVQVEAIMPAVSEVAITSLPIRKTTTEILRDKAGDIATSVQVETDA